MGIRDWFGSKKEQVVESVDESTNMQPAEAQLELSELPPRIEASHLDSELDTSRTPLHDAVVADGYSAGRVERLIRSGADVNAQDRDGNTPLHLIAESAYIDSGEYEIAQMLYSHGANPDIENKDGFTARKLAHDDFREDVLDGNNTPLHIAAREGDLQACEKWLDNSEAIHAKNDRGQTPLHCAAGQFDADIVWRLIEVGADVNATDKQGNTPLHVAAQQSSTEACRTLLDAGADVSIRNHQGDDALHLAVENGRDAVIERLLSATSFHADTAAVLADNFNPNAVPEANAVPSDTQAPQYRQRLR